MRRVLPVALLLPLAAAAAPLPPRGFVLDVSPACCAVTFTAYAFGVLPIEGRFGAFAGRIELHVPGGMARAEARIESASLSLDNGPIEADVKAPHFLDVARYPDIRFRAEEQPSAATLAGTLTLKGVTRPLTLALSERDGLVVAEARISRSAYGITARPILAGDAVRIRVTAPLPR